MDTAANRKHAGTLTTTCAECAPETFPETYYEMAVTICPQGFSAPPQRHDANCVVTTCRSFDDGAWGANGKLDTAANRKHAGTNTKTCAQGAPPIVEETFRERALRIALILADTVSKDSQVRIVVCTRPSRYLGKEIHIIKYT